MYCTNCGKRIPEHTNYCHHCGTKQPTSDHVDPVSKTADHPQNTVQSQPKQPKKKTNLVVGLAVVLCVSLVGKFAIAPLVAADPGNAPDTYEQSSQSQQVTESTVGSWVDAVDSSYEAIFEDTNIVHMPPFFNMETSSFALKEDDGTVYCSDYGYEDDVVKQWVETAYIPVSAYTDSEKAAFEQVMRSQFAAMEALSCCTVRYTMNVNSLIVTCTYTDVDQAEHYAELYNAELIDVNALISMSATEDVLLSQGYVKK